MTAEEKKEIKLAVLDEIKTESNDITEIETVSTLDGLTGLPAMQGKKLVTAPLSLLSKPATDAAVTANSAAVTANSAADTANKAAQTATNAAATANKAADTIKPWLRGSLGSFDSSKAFNSYLDGLSYDTLKSGRYVAYLGGVPLFVTFSLLSAKEQISAVWVEGSLMVRKNAIGSNTGEGVTIAYRYYKDGAWGSWKSLYDDVRADIPTAQTSANGTTKNFIYSSSGDEMHTALSGKIWTYTHGDGNLFLRFKHWGASNDTSESNYSQVMVANAWIGGNGVLRRDVYRRLDDFSLREENSTADAVNIVTPIFTTGGTRSFPISKATTAKAGVMTAADKMKLDGLSDISAEGARAAKALYAAAGGTKLFGPKNIFNTNNSTLTGAVAKDVYDSSTLTQYTKGSPFDVFCSKGIKSDIHSEKYMIWFGLRKSATNIERYSCQQVIGQTEEEFYKYETIVAFRLNDGEVYTPYKGSGGLDIGTSTQYIVSRECVIPSYSDLHDAATSEKDGLMSASDKAQLDVIAASIDSFGNSITEQAKRIYDLEQCKPLATKSRNGFMSSEDKTQLQGAFADFNARRQAHGVEGYIGKSNVISVPGTVGNAQIAAEFYRNAEERDYTPGASFDVYISAGYDENHPNKQCVWFGLHIGPTLYVRYRLDYWLHGTADTLVGKYLCDTSDKYYEVREGAVGEYISEALDDTPCIMTIADKRLLNQIKKKLGL